MSKKIVRHFLWHCLMDWRPRGGQLGQSSDDDGQSQFNLRDEDFQEKTTYVQNGGRADKKTARDLYAAGRFLTTLKQFGPMEKKLDNLRKYALISASRILKALRSGQRPMPPDGAVSNDLPGVPDIPTNNTPRVPDIPAAPRNDVLDIPPAPGQDDTKPSTGGFLDIPAAPGFGDEDNKTPSTEVFLIFPQLLDSRTIRNLRREVFSTFLQLPDSKIIRSRLPQRRFFLTSPQLPDSRTTRNHPQEVF